MLNPHDTPEWLLNWAQVINAAAVVILVLVTAYYAYETRETRRAADRQAEAARKQAQASQDTLAFLQAQIDEQAATALATLQQSVRELRQTAALWHQRMGQSGTLGQWGEIGLLPPEWSLSMERARRIAPGIFNDLQNLQRTSIALSGRIVHFINKIQSYPSSDEATAIRQSLSELIQDCDTASRKLNVLTVTQAKLRNEPPK